MSFNPNFSPEDKLEDFYQNFTERFFGNMAESYAAVLQLCVHETDIKGSILQMMHVELERIIAISEI